MARRALFDVDPGCDDAAMIALALASDDIEVVGLTAAAGNVPIEKTTRNALAVLDVMDRTDVPVARGCHRPFVDDLETAEHVHGPEGITGEIPTPSTAPVDAHAVEFILDRAREYGEELTLACVAPPTNVAVALAIEPDLPEMVDDIYLMGGTTRASGNITPAAEFNFYADPAAASRVVQDAHPKVVGLDVTERTRIDGDELRDLADSSDPLPQIAGWLGYADPAEIRAGKVDESLALHDPTVVVHLVEDVLTFEPYPMKVDTSGGPSRGALLCDRRRVTGAEPNALLATDIDPEAFRRALFDVLEAV